MTATDPMTGHLVSAALDYISRGWFVLPCRVGRKPDGRKDVRPIANWRQASTNDPAQVQAWFEPGGPWHGASLAIDTGKSGLVVVDLDMSGDKQGFTEWGNVSGELATLAHKTPSNGLHLFFRADPARPVGQSSDQLGHGVDTRGVGGFVIAPPSVDHRGAYEVTAAADWRNMTPVPAIVTERVPLGGDRAPSPSGHGQVPQRDPSQLGTLVPGDGIPKYTKAVANRRIQDALRTVMGTPQGHGFNYALNKAAFELGHWTQAHITRDDAEQLLFQAVTAQFPNGPNGQDLATIESGLQGGEAKPYAVLADQVAAMLPVTAGGEPDADAFELKVQEAYWRLKANEAARERLAAEKVIGDGDGKFDWGLLDQPDDPVEFLVPGVLAAGRSYALVGGAKAGKSYAARDFAVQAAEAGHPVLYLDRENTAKGDWVPHLRAMGVTPELQKRLDIRNFPAIAPLDTEVGGSTLVAWVQETGARVVFIDMFMRFISGKENDSDTFNAFDRYTGQKLKALGVTVVRLDHSGHDETGRARGSSAKAGDVDVQWMLTRGESTVTLDPKGISRQADQRDPIRLIARDRHLRVTTELAVERGADQTMVAAILEMLNDGDLTSRSSDRIVQERLRARGHKGRNEKMNAAWRAALRQAGVAGVAPDPEPSPGRKPLTPFTVRPNGVHDKRRDPPIDPGDHTINNSVGDQNGDQSPGTGITGISPGGDGFSPGETVIPGVIPE